MPWTIDTLTFDTVDRSLIEAEPVDHEITRTGADGTAFQVDAYRAASQEVVTTVRKAASAATAFRASCKGLELSTVKVTDQHGWKWTVYVRRARVLWSQQIDGYYLIRVNWLLCPRSERP